MQDERNPYHYDLIARAIRFIDAHAGEHPSLEQVARATGLSTAHFQRVFSAWTGVSPKRYQQYLTLDHARDLLTRRHSLLDVAYETGLSGTSRLHDLFLVWEAMTPGDYATGGAGLEIAWGTYDSPFGDVLVMATDRGICGMAFTGETGFDAAFADLTARWPGARFARNQDRLQPQAEAAFGTGQARLHLIGAPFQIKVWEALMNVPTGYVTTYSDLARRIGHPQAVRAVGTAVGRNPVSWLIPCHRALRKSGGLGGYHWGLPVKRAMLAWEAARAEGRDAA